MERWTRLKQRVSERCKDGEIDEDQCTQLLKTWRKRETKQRGRCPAARWAEPRRSGAGAGGRRSTTGWWSIVVR